MGHTGWRVALGAAASCTFFWGVAGAVDLGLERTHRGYTLPEGGGWYGAALFIGFIVAYLAVAGLTDRVAGWKAALLPASGAVTGAALTLSLGQETRHWIASCVLTAAGLSLPLVVHLRSRAGRAERNEDPSS
jgi:hypothetical protein